MWDANGKRERSTNPMPSHGHVVAAPDGGWGWMVVLAGFVQTALVFGVIRSFGVFFVEFVEYFRAPSSTVSWVVSLGVAVLQFASPVGSALSARYGARPVVMAGGFLSGLGLLLASFSTHLTHLYLSIGLLAGFGWALVFTPSMATVSRYFEKRRTLATGLAVSGTGISSLAFSPLFQYLVDSYGWRGALMLVAAMSLNLVVSGALLQPLALEGGDPLPKGQATAAKRPATLATFFSLELFSHTAFMSYTLAFVLVDTGYFVPYAHLVARAREVGCDEYQAAFIMSVVAVADLCGRIFAGWLADSRICGRLLHHLTLWTVLTGASLALLPLGPGYTSLLALGLCYGFFAGALVPLQFTSLVEIVGTGRLLGAIGLMHMLESVGALLGIPLSGWLRDLTGNYSVSFITAGAFLLASSLILATLPHYFSCSRSSEAEEDGTMRPQGHDIVTRQRTFAAGSEDESAHPGAEGSENSGKFWPLVDLLFLQPLLRYTTLSLSRNNKKAAVFGAEQICEQPHRTVGGPLRRVGSFSETP
ncbi:monocarboxylate transporter 13-like [Heteronotia binoei]|uniref:monocarboxylate transporter 13-like n=1 Tax=Heteronotia binoei TaxID=13085 RepID=UPI002930F56B|nr:monocarboxylate transporter 13-like [Heteronotia binoei]